MTTREEVRDRYAEAARGIEAGDRCGCDCETLKCCGTEGEQTFGQGLYSAAERADLPDTAVLASLGCGNPTAVADLHEGETVLDLGSGGGIDVILSASRVGPEGVAYGLDMTDEMLALARRNAAEAGVANVHFLKGVIEEIPLPAESVDVVISNCVINLSTDKAERAERGSHVGCVAGALSRVEYAAGLEAAGFQDVSIEFTHEVADGMHGAIVKAVKPG